MTKAIQKMRVYLDNCTFNRPFDDQSHIRIRIEAESKLFIQQAIKNGWVQLVWSYMLDIENDHNPFEEKRRAIEKWKRLSILDIEENEGLLTRADHLVGLGIKAKDALHVACAIEGKADYFVTTNDRLLKKLQSSTDIKAINPVDILEMIDGHHN